MPWRTEDMTPQQRANWALLQSVLDQEYERGFKRGLEVGREQTRTEAPDVPDVTKNEVDPTTEGILLMHTKPAEGPEKAIDIPRPML